MIKSPLKKIKCHKGAMDRPIVALLLVLIGVVALVALESWYSGQNENIETQASERIQQVIE